MNQQNQPKSGDLVLGGFRDVQPLAGSLVMGGLEKCKHHLAEATGDDFLNEVINATKYGDEGRALARLALHRFVTSSNLESVLILLTIWDQGKDILLEVWQSLTDEERLKLYSTVNQNTAVQIQELINLGEGARFRHYSSLKVGGKDCFSIFNKEELSELINIYAADLIELELEEHPDNIHATAMRWHLRGLSVDQAVHKVRVDQEISENAIKSRYKT